MLKGEILFSLFMKLNNFKLTFAGDNLLPLENPDVRISID